MISRLLSFLSDPQPDICTSVVISDMFLIALAAIWMAISSPWFLGSSPPSVTFSWCKCVSSKQKWSHVAWGVAIAFLREVGEARSITSHFKSHFLGLKLEAPGPALLLAPSYLVSRLFVHRMFGDERSMEKGANQLFWFSASLGLFLGLIGNRKS